jgi:hypothetical protein
MAKYKIGDTLKSTFVDGTMRYIAVDYVSKRGNYHFTNGSWMSIELVDRFWIFVGDEETEIEE